MLEWTEPPVGTGAVQFNVAANASNNDDSPLGDYIYTRTVRTLPVKGLGIRD